MFTPLLLKPWSCFSVILPEHASLATRILQTPLLVRRDRHLPYYYSYFRRVATLLGRILDNMLACSGKMLYILLLRRQSLDPYCFDRDR